jgi:chorismate mutase/prephenate dehydratase
MTNMNNNQENTLLQLRSKIDKIDNQIIGLLNDRMAVIEEVAGYKKSIQEKFFVKSAREADMIKALILKANPAIPKSTIVNIWRKIITSSNCLEQKLKIAIHNPSKINDYQYLVREYYGDFVPLFAHDSISNIVAEIEQNEVQIGVFALPVNGQNNHENWWINLANNQSGIRVFAKIPFIGESPHQLVAVAIKEPEKSAEDKTLLVMEVGKETSKHQIEETLNKAKFDAKILQSAKLESIDNITFYLVELEGFFDQTDKKIIELSKSTIKPFVKVLGHFAKTISS